MFDYDAQPSDFIFADLQLQARRLWIKKYHDSEGDYLKGKLEMVNAVENRGGNYWTLIGMFDWVNQQELIRMVQPETAELIKAALAYEDTP